MDSISRSRKQFIKISLSLVVLVMGGFLLRFYFFQPRWSAHLFSEINNGKDPEMTRHFQTLEECQSDSVKRIQEGYRMQNGFSANSFVCGQDCSFEGLAGSVFAEEIQCSEVYFNNKK